MNIILPATLLSMATVGPCGAGAPSGEGARMCAPCCPWARSWRHGLIHRSKSFINGCRSIS